MKSQSASRLWRAFLVPSASLVFLLGCSEDPVSVVPTPLPSSARAAAKEQSIPFESLLPVIGGVDGYTGSAACRSCHEREFETWHRSYHRTMTQIAAGDAVQADFTDVVLTNETARFRLSERDGEYWVRMEPISAPRGTIGLDVRLTLITGSHHMQVFWVPEGHGNLQIGFPFTWLIPEGRWVPRETTFIRPPGLPHRPEMWNIVCSRCHTTGVEPRSDVPARTFATRVAELGISCEACHGPGRKHAEARSAAVEKLQNASIGFEPNEIVHPRKIPPERASQICGFCHSMKQIDESGEWRGKGFEYRPGDDLEETTPIIRPRHLRELEEIPEFLARNPEILDDFFWSDGMIKVSGREYNGLIESPCFKGGQFSCLSCHSLHGSEPDDQLSRRGQSNRACTQCHDRFSQPAQLTLHTRHAPGSHGSSCYNCHMPHTTYGVLKAIRSHEVSSPSVASELETGRPNACNLCHLDKTLDWTASHLKDWFAQELPALARTRTNISHAVRLALTGNAGQRALLAWHFSWTPALQASGSNWIPPVLGQLLDDPYAAVRCVAERSIRALNQPLPPDYDFTIEPPNRPPVRDLVWTRWSQSAAPILEKDSAPLLAWPGNLPKQKAAYDAWILLRDDAPVRLRE